jgi:hypothetical protein
MGFGHWGHRVPPSEPSADSPAKSYQDRLLGGPDLIREPETGLDNQGIQCQGISGQTGIERRR